MPRLHINLPNLTVIEEWDEIEQSQRETAHQKQSPRSHTFRTDAQERRVFERRKYQRHAGISASDRHRSEG